MTAADGGFPRGFAGHRQAQARMGLRLTPAQRLRWLETTMETLRRWRGRARAPQTSPTPDTPDTPDTPHTPDTPDTRDVTKG